MRRFLPANKLGIIAFCLVILAGCDNSDEPEGAFAPQSKKLEGKYVISKVTRNGVDITSRFDFTAFALTFQSSGAGQGTYAIENNAPFLVGKSGAWKFDDPNYPFAVAFTEEGETTLNIATMLTPVTYEKSPLNFRFSPGCSSNVYEYTLTYTTPQ